MSILKKLNFDDVKKRVDFMNPASTVPAQSPAASKGESPIGIESLLVLGGGSDLANELVHQLIGRGLKRVVLAGRIGKSVDEATQKLAALGHNDPAKAIEIQTVGFDGSDSVNHKSALQAINDRHGPFDTVVVAFGQLGDVFTLQHDPGEAADLITVNFAGAVSSILAAIPVLSGQQNARLIVFSSITAVRPRIENLIYGSAKAGLDSFVTEITTPLKKLGINTLLVRPGFTPTAMTEGREPAPFATTKEQVAAEIIAAIKANKRVVHCPASLGAVGSALKMLPGPIWRVLNR